MLKSITSFTQNDTFDNQSSIRMSGFVIVPDKDQEDIEEIDMTLEQEKFD